MFAEIFRTFSSHLPKTLTLYKDHLRPLLASKKLDDTSFAALALLRKKSAKMVLKEANTDKRGSFELTEVDIKKETIVHSYWALLLILIGIGKKSLL
ncbi:hypothetical protein [Coxiella endosymbiont of Ornithodoros maritimus]|uniref:hypothetical protein n=1 Tax=Coxiella endosymbiont of Ornithodoros maritimus TaxID=1656172 RepID=UPI002B4001AC|nr:hypothetical protein [Coxiella endosymbiont of Ornithodoros maritimus]